MRFLLIAFFAAWACLSYTDCVAAEPKRWALLIGVNDYVDLNDLNYAGRDAVALGETLEQAGFKDHIFLLHDDAKETRYKPFKANIEKQLDIVLNLAGPDDLVIVSFSGHGMHIDGKSFLCPSEANDRRAAETMIAVDDVYKKFSDCGASLKLLVVDACRNDPRPPTRRSATPQADLKKLGAAFERPPEGIVVLASCGPGQTSYEDDKLKHGVFMHYVLQGLAGAADGNKNGRVTLGELYDYASSETKVFVARAHNDFQVPTQRGEINGVFELPRGGPPQHLANTIGMKLALIPAGQFLMGSRDDDSEARPREKPQHQVRITKPFYLGVHEVTRGEFAQFVAAENYRTEAERDGEGGYGYDEAANKYGKNPQYTWRNTGWAQTNEHPVVNVSWNDAQAFCAWLSKKEGKTYRLPTEAEWEYASDDVPPRLPFADPDDSFAYLGNVFDATANTKLPSSFAFAARDGYVFTAPVGKFNANRFHLRDVSGNVSEWCLDWYGEKYYGASPREDPQGPASGSSRVQRGSSWGVNQSMEFRGDHAPDDRSGTVGFRVVLVP